MAGRKQSPRQVLAHEFDALKRVLYDLNLPYGFSPEIVEQNLTKIRGKLKDLKIPCNLAPESIEDVAIGSEIFESMTRTDGRKYFYQRPSQEWGTTFVFDPAELEYVNKELCLCFADFRYWFYRYFFIEYKDGTFARPEEHISQQMMFEVIAEINRKGLPMLIMNLKARQLGISTFWIGLFLWISLFRSGSHIILASAEEEKSIDLCEKAWKAIDKLPLWMQPILTGEDRKRGPEFGVIKCDLQIQHGSMKKGMARGSTPVAALVSEVPYYPNPVETIESSLLRAMHENPRTVLVLEGTAKKKGDWYHRTWEKNRAGESTGFNRFTCLFFPWYVGRDKYPTVDWIRNHPVPDNWQSLKETQKQALDAKLYVRTTPLLQRYMGENWEMPREQQWFWEFNFVEASREDQTLKSFYAEMAADERSCFQSKRWSVFKQSVLDNLREGMSEKFQDYAVVGDGIMEKFHLRDFQSASGRRIDIPWMTMEGKQRNWRLVPLREPPEDDHLQLFLRVWEHPKPGYDYTIPIDIGAGIGSDASVLDVIRVAKKSEEPDIQVAQLWSPYMSSAEIPPFANALGVYYGRHMSPIPQAKMVPETQVATGDPISYQLAADGYLNFHYFDRIDTRKTPGHQPNRRGWATTTWSRYVITENLRHGIENGWIIVNSEHTMEDIENLESEETEAGREKMEHAEGERDDCYLSLAIGYYTSHDEQTMAARKDGRLKPRASEELEKPPEPEVSSSEVMLARHFMREDDEFGKEYDEEIHGPVF